MYYQIVHLKKINYSNRLHVVSHTQQCRQSEPSDEAMCDPFSAEFGGIECTELNAALCLDTREKN